MVEHIITPSLHNEQGTHTHTHISVVIMSRELRMAVTTISSAILSNIPATFTYVQEVLRSDIYSVSVCTRSSCNAGTLAANLTVVRLQILKVSLQTAYSSWSL